VKPGVRTAGALDERCRNLSPMRPRTRASANGVVHERFLVLSRWSESSFVAFRFKARAVERQRVARGCVVVVTICPSRQAWRDPPPMWRMWLYRKTLNRVRRMWSSSIVSVGEKSQVNSISISPEGSRSSSIGDFGSFIAA
jgi:hypothetical protein